MSSFPPDPQVHEFLARAVEISRQKMREGHGGPFGAVVARGGQLLAEGWNRVTSAHDPTAHAEVVAIRRACREIAHFDLEGCVIYTSCEPCPMCLGAIYWARLDAIVYANTRDDAAIIGFDDSHFYDQMALPPAQQRITTRHLPSKEAKAVFEEWIDLDGKTPY